MNCQSFRNLETRVPEHYNSELQLRALFFGFQTPSAKKRVGILPYSVAIKKIQDILKIELKQMGVIIQKSLQ